jgi:rhodanese-related sulfurtransferase
MCLVYWMLSALNRASCMRTATTTPERAVMTERGRRIVAYCRGPHCVLAPQEVELLRRHRFRARRLEDGMPEWRLAGLPVAVGQE